MKANDWTKKEILFACALLLLTLISGIQTIIIADLKDDIKSIAHNTSDILNKTNQIKFDNIEQTQDITNRLDAIGYILDRI